MGSYASVADVQDLLTVDEFEITVSSEPDITAVEGFISQTEGEVNGVLTAQGYNSVPATGSNDIELIQGYVTERVAAKTWMVAFVDDDPPFKVKTWLQDYRDFIARLRRGEQHLIDQLPQGEEEPFFGIIRHPTRDDFFTERHDTTDWDE